MDDSTLITRESLYRSLVKYKAEHENDPDLLNWNAAVSLICSCEEAPNAERVVRCKDCAHCSILWGNGRYVAGWCHMLECDVTKCFYCAYGTNRPSKTSNTSKEE